MSRIVRSALSVPARALPTRECIRSWSALLNPSDSIPFAADVDSKRCSGPAIRVRIAASWEGR